MSYPSVEQRMLIDNAVAWMEAVMSNYDPSHDALHVHRVRKTAMKLASQHSYMSPDLLIVELSAIFHDLLDKKYRSQEASQDISTYDFFLPFFQENGHIIDLISTGQAKLISEIVDNVSWSTEKALRNSGGLTEWHRACIELHCVQDADRLDAMGAIGVMRCAGYSCVKNRPLVLPGDFQNTSSAIGHFYDKLFYLKERLKTEPGRRMGEARHQLMVDFVHALQDECSG